MVFNRESLWMTPSRPRRQRRTSSSCTPSRRVMSSWQRRRRQQPPPQRAAAASRSTRSPRQHQLPLSHVGNAGSQVTDQERHTGKNYACITRILFFCACVHLWCFTPIVWHFLCALTYDMKEPLPYPVTKGTLYNWQCHCARKSPRAPHQQITAILANLKKTRIYLKSFNFLFLV